MGRLFEGAIFDLDGVVTNTAELHFESWCEVLHPLRLTREGYEEYFDGRTREAGLGTYLRSIGAEANVTWIADKLEHKADAYDLRIIANSPLQVYDDTRRLLDWLGEINIPCAIASSSKRAPQIVRAAGLDNRFAWVSNGTTPKPGVYHEAATGLGLKLSDCAVFEDSPHAVALTIAAGAKYAVFVRKTR
jgi:beta-phosphoglucomutase